MLAYWLMAVTTNPRVGATFDEPGHITSGYAYWKFGDFRINAENGVLGTRAAALPLLGMDLRFPPHDRLAWQQPNTRALAGDFFFETGNDFRPMLARPRMISALFGAGLLILIWAWARGLFGGRAGWLALVLAAFSPTLLAQGGLATSDIVVSCCLLAALSAFWRLWHGFTLGRLALASLATGATLLAKNSGLLLLPMLAVLFALRVTYRLPLPVRLGGKSHCLRTRAAVAGGLGATLVVAAVAGYALIWAAYGFRFAAAAPGSAGQPGFDPPWETVLAGAPHEPAAGSSAAGLIESGFTRPAPAPLARTVGWFRQRHALPEAYLWSIAFTFQASRTRPSFLWGEASTTGSRWFFPAAFLLKTTPAELLLFAIGIGCVLIGWWRGQRATSPLDPAADNRPKVAPASSRHGRGWPAGSRRYSAAKSALYRAAPLLGLFVIYWLVALNTPLNIGHRHLLPIYAVVFVFAGAAAVWLRTRFVAIAAPVLGLAVAAQAVDSWSARPFYLSYFTAGARAHPWRYLVDSSYDWGQGLPDLERWMATKTSAGDRLPVFLSYFGSDSPRARGLTVTRVADWRDDTGQRTYPAPLRGGWYAISATNFQRVYLGVSGPWSPQYEQRYQELKASFPKNAEAAARLTATEREAWLRNAMLFEILQFGRLCHYLRDETPAAVLGSSILLFRLTDEEVNAIKDAPLADLEAWRGRRVRAR